MALAPTPLDSADAKSMMTTNGLSLFMGGRCYVQYGNATQLTNSNTETSILFGSPSTWSGAIQGASNYPVSTLTLPVGSFPAGTMYNGEFYGTIGTTGTPTLRLRLFLVDAVTGTATAIVDNAALALTAAAAGSAFKFGFWFTPTSTTGVRASLWYAQGTTVAGSALRFIEPAPQDTSGIDMTRSYYIDVRATFSAASTSNSIQVQAGHFGLLG